MQLKNFWTTTGQVSRKRGNDYEKKHYSKCFFEYTRKKLDRQDKTYRYVQLSSLEFQECEGVFFKFVIMSVIGTS